MLVARTFLLFNKDHFVRVSALYSVVFPIASIFWVLKILDLVISIMAAQLAHCTGLFFLLVILSSGRSIFSATEI